MAKFILNRPDDSLSMSRGKIIGKTLIWMAILVVPAIILRVVCLAVYMSMGMNPMELTSFGGDAVTRMADATWKTLLQLMIYAPIVEELIFRLGLSFKRITAALWVGLLPLAIIFYFNICRIWYILLGLVVIGLLIYWLVVRYTTDEQWKHWRGKLIIPSMWISAVGFGLIHLVAFSVLNWQLLPFAISTILIPMAGGCVFTYARVNLGFWWGVLFHCIFNIPGVLMITVSMMLANGN